MDTAQATELAQLQERVFRSISEGLDRAFPAGQLISSTGEYIRKRAMRAIEDEFRHLAATSMPPGDQAAHPLVSHGSRVAVE